MSTLGLFLLATLVGSNAPRAMSDEDVEWYATGIAYRQCVEAAAVRLEPSGETPQDIARASLVSCSRIHERAFPQIRARVRREHPGMNTQNTELIAFRAMQLTDEAMTNRALLKVIQIRSSRRRSHAQNR
jgi:hypothetical protein